MAALLQNRRTTKQVSSKCDLEEYNQRSYVPQTPEQSQIFNTEGGAVFSGNIAATRDVNISNCLYRLCQLVLL